MKGNRTDIREIKERANIIAVISRYVSLTKSGASHKGRCPFHKDDTPSFVVSAEKGLWHCFGCGEGGDIIAFLMKIERLSFVEAAKRLAVEVGLSFAGGEGGEGEKLRGVVADVARHYVDNLRSAAEGKRAREYLQERGYVEASWARFGLGYALPGWDNVKRMFAPRYGVTQLVELGLLVRGEKGVYDRFRDRTIFPILDLSGRAVAFGGRAFEGEPKYLNSPKTQLFDKGRLLYGLCWAREALAETRTAILVEGYTDVLTLHQAGLTNAVGSMGTSLTQGQADLLGRFAEEVVIAYDRDAAGGAAALRGMQILRNSGLQVRVARLAQGEDPDGVVREEGVDQMRETVEKAIPFHRFHIDSLLESHDLSTIRGKEKILSEARAFYRGIRSLPLRQEIAREFAELLDLPVEGVARELSTRRPARPIGQELKRDEEAWGEEETLLVLLLRGDVSWDGVAEDASPEDFSPPNRPIAEALASGAKSSNIAELVGTLDEESARRASYYALAPVVFSDPERAARDALSKLVRIPAIERKLADLDTELSACKEAEDWDRWNELTREKVALVAEKLARKGSDAKEKADGRSGR
jgi:DNA primase